jgi:hypothetical protein
VAGRKTNLGFVQGLVVPELQIMCAVFADG